MLVKRDARMGKKSRERREKIASFLNHQHSEMLEHASGLFGFAVRNYNYTNENFPSESAFHRLACQIVWQEPKHIIRSDGFLFDGHEGYDHDSESNQHVKLEGYVKSLGCCKPPFFTDDGYGDGFLIDFTPLTPTDGDDFSAILVAGERTRLLDNAGCVVMASTDDGEIIELSLFFFGSDDGRFVQGYGMSRITLDSTSGCVLSLRTDTLDDCAYAHTLEFTHQVLSTLAFMNQNGAEIVDSDITEPLKRHYKERYGLQLVTYKTLVIKSNEKRYSREDKPQERFDVMPLHFRRAHTATYTEDKPLFGKYAGTFPRRASVVGNEKNGTIFKGYELEAHESGGI